MPGPQALTTYYLLTYYLPGKVGAPYQYFEWSVPVVHFREVRPPFVTCVALGRTGGAFEANLASLGLTEGRDYFLFG